MPMQPCLLVRLADGELARTSLLSLRILDHNYAPLRIGDELALPIHEDASFNKLEFDFRLEKIEVKLHHPLLTHTVDSMQPSNR